MTQLHHLQPAVMLHPSLTLVNSLASRYPRSLMDNPIALLQNRSEGHCNSNELCWFRHDDPDSRLQKDDSFCACPTCIRRLGHEHLPNVGGPRLRAVKRCPSTQSVFPRDPQIATVQLKLVPGTNRKATTSFSEVQKEGEKSRSRPKLSSTVVKHRVSSSHVVFGPGASIERIVLPSNPSHVVVSNLSLNVTESDLKFLFAKHGFKFYIHQIETSLDGLHKTALVVFNDNDAKKAASVLDGVKLHHKKLILQPREGQPGQLMDSSPSNPNTIHISWELPHASAVVIYKDDKAARSKLTELENTILDGKAIQVRVKRSLASKILFTSIVAEISGLPVDANREYIRDFTGAFFVGSVKRTRYGLNRAYTALRREVDRACFVSPIDYQQVDSEIGSGMVAVHAQFQTWEQARTVRDKLAPCRLRYIGGKRLTLSLENPFRYSSIVSVQQYKVQERMLKSIMDGCKDNLLASMQIRLTSPSGPLCIEVFGHNKNSVGALKVRVEQILAGDRISVWDTFFTTTEGAKFLDVVSHDNGVLLRPDVESYAIRVFGEAARFPAARQALMSKLIQLGSHPVQIDSGSVHFFETEGVPILTEIVGKENVILDATSSPPTIRINGATDEVHHILRGLIAESRNYIKKHSPNTMEPCPICFDSVTNPVRLECGHVYCHSCIRHFLDTAADVGIFPLCCVSCNTPLSIAVLRRFLDTPRLKQLLDASFYAYVHNHPDEYRYCPTPSCSVLYRVADPHSNPPPSFDCPSCFRSLCMACHSIPHQGMTCEEWSFSQDNKQQDKMLEKWMEKKKENVKRCPRCSVLIEKDFGCNHVKCRCGTHICWKCMRTFSSGIYDHLSAVHGGAFEQ